MRIVPYKPEYQPYFERLNRAWIEKYFEMEAMDEILLSNPEEEILKNGGRLYFVEYQNQIIGTVALIHLENKTYELAKMAVDEAFRGIGAGKFLCNMAIQEARNMQADKLILFTNSVLQNAIGIYRQLGFREVPLENREYKRADTKMELVLKSEPSVKWFDRQFDFDFEVDQFPHWLSRLERTSAQIHSITRGLSEEDLNFKPANKWSIKEQIGHLWILESLWQKRFVEIKERQAKMSPADLNNTATDKALFNQYTLEKLLNDFQQERIQTLQLLKSFEEDDLESSLPHPRLNQSMRIIDLMYFVAEHDAHHLDAIIRILVNKNHL